ncbi:MAG: hypothetical protein ABI651_06465 [Verrucomicrobiota bacterium]
MSNLSKTPLTVINEDIDGRVAADEIFFVEQSARLIKVSHPCV